MSDVFVPLDVPAEKKEEFISNYNLATHNTPNLMLFAGDQKIEHMNDDFYGNKISLEDENPEHLFKIASRASIGVFATQLGEIARYGADYPHIPYLVKMNSKTNLIKVSQDDPESDALYEVEQIIEFKKRSQLPIVALGYTLYIGSEHEALMLKEAAQIIYKAHQNGLFTVLWMYPRGKAVLHERDPHIIAGAAGVASTLGSDFAKVNYPEVTDGKPEEALKEAVEAAGRTKVICAGGEATDAPIFLKTLDRQLHISGTKGCATGRNIHQKSEDEAIRLCNAISSLVYDNKTIEDVLAMVG